MLNVYIHRDFCCLIDQFTQPILFGAGHFIVVLDKYENQNCFCLELDPGLNGIVHVMHGDEIFELILKSTVF